MYLIHIIFFFGNENFKMMRYSMKIWSNNVLFEQCVAKFSAYFKVFNIVDERIFFHLENGNFRRDLRTSKNDQRVENIEEKKKKKKNV